MTLFSFKKGSKYLWLILLSPIAYTSRSENFINHPMLISAIMFLGEIIAGLYQFIINANSETKVKKKISECIRTHYY